MSQLSHPHAPVFDEHARVLLLGTFPSPASRAGGFYYLHPQNRFWPVMAAVLDTKLPQTNEERRALLLSHRIALWDVLASCEITGASDSSIKNPVPCDLGPLLSAAPIQAIFTTGQTALRLYKRHLQTQVNRAAAALPSTSPANATMKLPELIVAYRAILPFIENTE